MCGQASIHPSGQPSSQPSGHPSSPPSRPSSCGKAHLPIFVRELVAFFAPISGKTFIDGTFGAGGHSEIMFEHGASHIIACDRDPDCTVFAERLRSRLSSEQSLAFHGACLSQFLRQVPPELRVDGIILDLGMSSMQLDTPERGFSYNADGPLDMRMSQSGTTAAQWLAQASVKTVTEALRTFGDVAGAARIARTLHTQAKAGRLQTTGELRALLCAGVAPPLQQSLCKRVFQAIRIAVNSELDELHSGLIGLCTRLARGGRIAVLSFHSLEDRICKRHFQALSAGKRPDTRSGTGTAPFPHELADRAFAIVTKKAVTTSNYERFNNPRAMSPKLRVLERIA